MRRRGCRENGCRWTVTGLVRTPKDPPERGALTSEASGRGVIWPYCALMTSMLFMGTPNSTESARRLSTVGSASPCCHL